MIIFPGGETAWRDPACCFYNGEYHLFCTKSVLEEGYMYNVTVHSTSRDLINWSKPQAVTEKDRFKNFCSPGSIIPFGNEYILCLTSYPMPLPWRERGYADDTARLFLMRTKDFSSFSAPEPLHPKGCVPFEQEGRMIDPFLMRDPNDEGRFLLFFKQNGVSLSVSRDLVRWDYQGHIDGGENACVLVRDGRCLLIHSPKNGIGLKVSDDLLHWEDKGLFDLNQDANLWASGRLTAGFAMESRGGTRYRYILFFHGSPKDAEPETHGRATLAAVFTDDFVTFSEDPF